MPKEALKGKKNGLKRAQNHRSSTSEEEAHSKVKATKQRVTKRHTKPTKV
jgi:hypothetical protein